VSDPQAPAGVPAQPGLSDLADQVAELDLLVREIAVGTEEEIAGLKTAMAELGRVVAGRSSAAKPVAWLQYATRKDWQALADWIDWLVLSYELQPSRTILPCWPAHPGVVEELAALRQAWLEAATRGRDRIPNDAMIFWHDRWLHPCTIRLREVSQYRLCVDGHKAVTPARVTNADLLATALAAAPEDPAAGPATFE
jgi:hypothetical protein